MRKTVYRLKKFRLNEVSLVDRPACDIATLERIELIKRRDALDAPHSNTDPAQENDSMTSEELNALPDSAFAYIEPGGSKDAIGKTVPRSLRHFPIHDPEHVRNALARVKESKFGAKALPAILAAAKHFGIDVESHPQPDAGPDNQDQKQHARPETEPASPADRDRNISMSKSKSDVDPAIGFAAETVTADYPPGASIAGDATLAGIDTLAGKALPIEADYTTTLAPGELRKYVPIDALPIAQDDEPPTDATSLSAAVAENAGEHDLGELCDLFMMVARNIFGAAGIEDKSAAILTAVDDFKAAVAKLLAEPQLTKRLGPSRWRERAMKVEHAMRTSLRKRALTDALHRINFTWPADTAAIRVLDKDDRLVGWLGKADFQKRGATLSAANRDNLHQARDILVNMCAGAGCDQDRTLSTYLDNPIDASPAAVPGKQTASASRAATGSESAAELGKLLDDLRHAAGTLGSAANEVRKVAEASAGSIRKSEGSAKVLTALADRVARLEAQPDVSRPQPLRAVEKGILLESAAPAAGDIRLRITQLQSEAAELHKRGGDVAAQKRLSEIGVEIIRLSNGAYYPAT